MQVHETKDRTRVRPADFATSAGIVSRRKWGVSMIRLKPSPFAIVLMLCCCIAGNVGAETSGPIIGWGDPVIVPQTALEDLTIVAACSRHGLAVKTDGGVVAWGSNGDGQCDVPEPNIDFIAIGAGFYHALALRVDGSIVAWGNNDDGLCDVPAPNEGFVAISGGWTFSLGLKDDGRIEAWGWNGTHQCEPPAFEGPFIDLAAGLYSSLGVRATTPTGFALPQAGHQSGTPDLRIRSLYPNPFNPSTELRFWLPAAASVSLGVFDAGGRSVATLQDNASLAAGEHTFTWLGRGDSAGRCPRASTSTAWRAPGRRSRAKCCC